MTVVMHGPDAGDIDRAIYRTGWDYKYATRRMIELGAMWYIDLHGLSSNDADDLWQQLEEKYADYKTETSKELTGVFGIGFKDRDDYERCFDRFIDFRNHFPGSLTSWLIGHGEQGRWQPGGYVHGMKRWKMAYGLMPRTPGARPAHNCAMKCGSSLMI